MASVSPVTYFVFCSIQWLNMPHFVPVLSHLWEWYDLQQKNVCTAVNEKALK